MAKIETLLARVYDVDIEELEPHHRKLPSPGVRIWLHEKHDDNSEGLGFFLKLHGCITYQWHDLNTNVKTGTAYDETMLRKAIKKRAFDSKYANAE